MNGHAYVRYVQMAGESMEVRTQETTYDETWGVLTGLNRGVYTYFLIANDLGVHALHAGEAHRAMLVSAHARGTIVVRSLDPILRTYTHYFIQDAVPMPPDPDVEDPGQPDAADVA
jgi:hypothetical protein